MAERWVEGPRGALCALDDGVRGWLMHVDPDDAYSFVSRDPAYAGPADAERTFTRDNGQADTYPEGWTLPLVVVDAAMEEYARTGRLSRAITWVDDFGSDLVPADAGL